VKLIAFNPQAIDKLIDNLSDDTLPEWGSMSPRKMLRHLVDIARISNGKIQVEFANKQEDLPKLRHILYKEVPFPRGYSAPSQVEFLLKDDVAESLPELRQELIDELLFFEKHFDGNRVETNAVFGPLDRNDWIQFHRKHMSHHLTQFGLWEY